MFLNVVRQQIPQQVPLAQGHHIGHCQAGTDDLIQQLAADLGHHSPLVAAEGSRQIGLHHLLEGRGVRRAAELFVENLRDIYPLPEKVSTRATTSLGEVRQPRFPSVLLELGYHDNPDDALWIQVNIPRIAANLVLSLTEYFGLPYTAPTPQPGQVSTVSGGPVNLRSGPSLQSTVTARLPDGDGVTVYGRYQDWYVVSHGEHLGYVSAPFIRLS